MIEGGMEGGDGPAVPAMVKPQETKYGSREACRGSSSYRTEVQCEENERSCLVRPPFSIRVRFRAEERNAFDGREDFQDIVGLCCFAAK